ncbi:MAG: hypothetical protein B6U89_07765 [Desulfurococcales archaeon ex4484_58]|nr:MAG: hypothetical protein B6U89_07765 [Desulfurococcales archaeon ex4484_58]
MYPIGVHQKILNRIVWVLREKGIWVERHSYSFRIMYRERIVGSLHLYPGYNLIVLKLYSGELGTSKKLARIINGVLNNFLPNYSIEIYIENEKTSL